MITLFIDKAGHFGIASLIYYNFMRIFENLPSVVSTEGRNIIGR